jgi:hypothetical protein
MTSERKLQMMQDALDGELSPEAERELSTILETDTEGASQYNHLQQVEQLLQAAPHERAPERLAVTIMARIAQAAKAQPQAQTNPEITEEMMQTAMQLVTVAALPMLVGAGWMLLNAQTDPQLLESVLYHVSVLFLIMMDVMQVVIERAQALYVDDPELAIALLALMPNLLLALVEEVLGMNGQDEES